MNSIPILFKKLLFSKMGIHNILIKYIYNIYAEANVLANINKYLKFEFFSIVIIGVNVCIHKILMVIS
jgi:hypothetical protein